MARFHHGTIKVQRGWNIPFPLKLNITHLLSLNIIPFAEAYFSLWWKNFCIPCALGECNTRPSEFILPCIDLCSFKPSPQILKSQAWFAHPEIRHHKFSCVIMEHTYIIMTSTKFGSDRNESVYVCWLTIYLLYKQYMLFNCDNFRVSINTLRLKVIQTNPQGSSFCVAFNYGWIIDPGVIFQKALLLSAFSTPFSTLNGESVNDYREVILACKHYLFMVYTVLCMNLFYFHITQVQFSVIDKLTTQYWIILAIITFCW